MNYNERGQSLPIAGFLLGVMVLVAVLVAHVAAAANTQARAQTGADAAALAGVAAGEGEAQQAAEANGGTLAGFQRDGTDVQVEVQIGDRKAIARARLQGGLQKE